LFVRLRFLRLRYVYSLPFDLRFIRVLPFRFTFQLPAHSVVYTVRSFATFSFTLISVPFVYVAVTFPVPVCVRCCSLFAFYVRLRSLRLRCRSVYVLFTTLLFFVWFYVVHALTFGYVRCRSARFRYVYRLRRLRFACSRLPFTFVDRRFGCLVCFVAVAFVTVLFTFFAVCLPAFVRFFSDRSPRCSVPVYRLDVCVTFVRLVFRFCSVSRLFVCSHVALFLRLRYPFAFVSRFVYVAVALLRLRLRCLVAFTFVVVVDAVRVRLRLFILRGCSFRSTFLRSFVPFVLVLRLRSFVLPLFVFAFVLVFFAVLVRVPIRLGFLRSVGCVPRLRLPRVTLFVYRFVGRVLS